jgi:hypothetical protein
VEEADGEREAVELIGRAGQERSGLVAHSTIENELSSNSKNNQTFFWEK